MWQINLVTNAEGRSTLRCENIQNNTTLATANLDRLLITHLEIYKHTGPRASIVIKVNKPALSDKLFSKLQKLKDTHRGISRLRITDINTSVKLQINYEHSLAALKGIIKILDQEIAGFQLIRSNLPTILAVDKQNIIDNLEQHQQEFVSGFERLIENTMTATVHASMRASEQTLRHIYDFPYPPPGTWPANGNQGNHVMFEDYAADDEDDRDEYDERDEYYEGEDDFSDDERSDRSNTSQLQTEYKQFESKLINNLHEHLEDLEIKYLRKGYIERNPRSRWGIDLILTNKSINLISAPVSSVNQAELEIARHALNVIAARRAISFRGSHYTNTGMYHTQLHGYGMRNVVALMWNCCKKAAARSSFPTGVTFNDALLALAQGIADGARGDNRNRNSYDDLLDDRQTCDQGKYNAIFNAMLSIFPEIVIIYDYTDMLLIALKHEIVQNMVSFVEQKDEATQLLKIWVGLEKEESMPIYAGFRLQLLAKFPSILNKFIETQYSTATESLKRKILDQIKEDIKKIEDLSFGLKYLETVSPTQQLLDIEWHKQHPPREEIAKQNRKRVRIG